MPGRQNRVIVPGVALSRADITNAAVTMIEVVPMDEGGGPSARLLHIGKALGRCMGGRAPWRRIWARMKPCAIVR